MCDALSIADAGKALAACQGARLEGQEAPLRLGYARDRFADQPQHFYAAQYEHHMATEAAAEAALAMAGWAPKEFGEGAGQAGGDDDDPLAAWERQQAAEAAAEAAPATDGAGQAAAGGQEAAADAAPTAGGAAEQQQQEQQQGQQQQERPESAEQEEGELGYDPLAAAAELHAAEAQQEAAAAAAAALAAQRAAAEVAGFCFDPESGYMLEPVSGYYYDANSGGLLGRVWCSTEGQKRRGCGYGEALGRGGVWGESKREAACGGVLQEHQVRQG